MLFYQPGDGQFGDLLITEISKEHYKKFNHLAIIVAYAKHSGVSRIAEALEQFAAAGGTMVAVVGIDQRHTTIEALELLRDAGATVYVYYDEDLSRTFHPKAFWLSTDGVEQWAAIGSNNLTAGGLYLNYELAVISTDPADSDAGRQVVDTLSKLFDSASAENAELLKLLDDTLLANLVTKGYILSEQQAKERERASIAQANAANSIQSGAIFGRSRRPKISEVPAKYALPVPATGSPPSSAVPATSASPPATAAQAAAVVVGSPKGFWKKLSAWDVSPSSSPGQIIIPLMFKSLFPPLGPPSQTASGATQAETNFDVEYRAPGAAPKLVKNIRLITYEPAPNHPRRNVELRLTFHDKSIDATLNAGDKLEFIQTGSISPAFIVTKTTAPAGGKNFDFIP